MYQLIPREQHRQLYCNACTWHGAEPEAVYCGSVGPLCPECYETTGAEQPSPVLAEQQP